MRPARARRAAPAIAGSPATSVRRGAATNVSCPPTSSQPFGLAMTTHLPWCCPRQRSWPWTCSWRALPKPCPRACTPCSCWTKPARANACGISLARPGGAAGARQHHPVAAATVFAGTQPGGAGLASLRERFLSFRLCHSEQAITDALRAAWNALPDETGRLTTLTSYPWITQAINQVSR